MKNFLILLLSIFFFSCQQKENKNTAVPVTESPSPAKKEMKENKQMGDTIFMNYKNENGLFTAEGLVDSIQSHVYIKFKNEYPAKLNGKIIPEPGLGNIRFNQIIFPDKTSDGPFGIELKTNIEQKGDYILVIGHSQMADGKYWGKFKVEIENKKRETGN
ncbi:hypothetical protein [Flavobacterium gelatinilyticum]|uniref:hypothetical protein n=1 Tax=Flavobacterium gelatinilyticum TaxID=3003260 RepID=UPI0024810BFD|nr:hypothetical protein [Flavobacterium gelatinilyticum]